MSRNVEKIHVLEDEALFIIDMIEELKFEAPDAITAQRKRLEHLRWQLEQLKKAADSEIIKELSYQNYWG